MTTQQCFELFLDGIKKERTTVVSIPAWNRLINESQSQWLKNKAPGVELTQSLIDDLSRLRVVTDGTQTWSGNTLNPITPISGAEKSFSYPTGKLLPNYPRYFRLLNVEFKIAYYDSNTGLYSDVQGYEYASILRSDKRAVTSSNYYRRAKRGRLYYEIVGDAIRIVSEANCKGSLMRLEYLRYPEKIWLDETNLVDHTTEDKDKYAAGYGSIPCELDDIQTQEIIDLAVRTYLERNSDQRLPTFTQEQQLK